MRRLHTLLEEADLPILIVPPSRGRAPRLHRARLDAARHVVGGLAGEVHGAVVGGVVDAADDFKVAVGVGDLVDEGVGGGAGDVAARCRGEGGFRAGRGC